MLYMSLFLFHIKRKAKSRWRSLRFYIIWDLSVFSFLLCNFYIIDLGLQSQIVLWLTYSYSQSRLEGRKKDTLFLSRIHSQNWISHLICYRLVI